MARPVGVSPEPPPPLRTEAQATALGQGGKRLGGGAAALALGLLAAACTSTPPTASGSFGQPLDFAYACEGEGATQAPDNDVSAANYAATRMCPDVTRTLADGSTKTQQGALLGLVLNRTPPSALVIQMNPAAGARRVLDADLFTPGLTGIALPEEPVRLVASGDFGAFYAVSAGARPTLTRIVVEGYDGAVVHHREDAWPLPGTPADALMLGDRLVVTAAAAPVWWVYDVTADGPGEPRTVGLPDVARRLVPDGEGGDGPAVVVTWRSLPQVTRLTLDGQVLARAGLVASCADGLDDDGDGLTDREDPDCGAPTDRERTGGEDALPAPGTEAPALEPPASAPLDAAPPCEDGVDNDRDGLTDAADPACAGGDPQGELLAACEDGVDEDGDGLTDMDDPSCYKPWGLHEGALGAPGPFLPTVVDAGAAGRFVYVLNQEAKRLLVFEEGADGASLTRVDVNALEDEGAALAYRRYSDTETAAEQTREALRTAARPGLSRAGDRDLVLGGVATDVASVHAWGELWARPVTRPADGTPPSVAQGLSSSTSWIPGGCAVDVTDRCVEPAGDGESYLVVAPRFDGRVSFVQAVFRGRPRHRFTQLYTTPERRTWSASKPVVVLPGASKAVSVDGVREGIATLGPAKVETISEAVEGEAPPVVRSYGLWQPEDPEGAPSEGWSLTYEGVIPGASGVAGRVVGDGVFYAPGERFCEDGVAPGDWLVVDAAALVLDGRLRHPDNLSDALNVTAGGTACATAPLRTASLQVRVTEVGMETLRFDPASVEALPTPPTLDEAAIAEASYRRLDDCRAALEEQRATLLLDHPPVPVGDAVGGLEPGYLPRRVSYRVRAAGQWVAVGSRSGFLHRQRWVDGACVEDATLSPLLAGRVAEAPVQAGQTLSDCPLADRQTEYDRVDGVFDTAGRLVTPSFGVDVLPACRVVDGAVQTVGSERGTRWVFSVTGPDRAASTLAASSGMVPRLGALGFRRELVYLDAGANRVSTLWTTGAGTSTFPLSFE